MSQYPLVCDIITNVQHLLKWRNIKHTAAQHANKKHYAKRTANIQLRNKEQRSNNYSCLSSVLNIMYSGCVSVALVTRHVIYIRPIILLSLAYLAIPHLFQFIS